MTKKSRRVRRKGVQPRLSKAQLVQPTHKVIEEAAPVVKMPATEKTVQSPETDFREEYNYVANDLRRIGVLAAAILGGLLILSVVL